MLTATTGATQTSTKAIDPRHVARALALQNLYNYFATDKGEMYELADLIEEYGVSEFKVDIYNGIVEGVKDCQPALDKLIEKLAPLWPLKQTALLDLTIIRMGIWEGFVSNISSPRIAIDEAIELTKEFSPDESSPRFVNGVLAALLDKPELQNELKETLANHKQVNDDTKSN